MRDKTEIRPAILVGTTSDDLADSLTRALASFAVERVTTPSELWRAVKRETYDLVVIDSTLGAKIAGVLRRRLAVKERPPEVLELASRPTPNGGGQIAYNEDLARTIAEIFAKINRRKAMERTGLIGRSNALIRISEIVLQVAPTPVTVLIEGESGTGKELIARAIHGNSARADGRFVVLNCGALAEGVLESELFGHEKGAFTGAGAQRKGMFELAGGGTLFLDEVGELPLATQVKLLRVLEEREFMRVGGTVSLQTDARVVAATNRSLARDVERGRFRQDLYFRLCVVRIGIPPLRERPEDIEPLFWHFVRAISEDVGRPLPRVSRAAIEALEDYAWPGSVRELRNFVESVVVVRGGDEIKYEDVESYVADHARLNPRLPVPRTGTQESVGLELVLDALVALRREVSELRKDLNLARWAGPLHEIEVAHEVGQPGAIQSGKQLRPVASMEEVEREMIENALREARGNRRKAAAMLGIGERTLYRKIQKYELQEVR